MPSPLTHVPSEDDLDCLADILSAAGRSLLAAQPQRALADEVAMQHYFEQRCTSTLNQMSALLYHRWPAIPVVPSGLTPDRLPSMEGPYWLCDPLDGAIQYLAGLPLWSTTLTLMVGHRPQLAVVHDPTLGRTYHAARNRGASCNGTRISCGQRRALACATVGTSFPNLPRRPVAELRQFLGMMERVVPAVLAQRWIGSATLSLAMVASGRLDGYWETGRHLVDWLPGLLIAQEAGVTVSPFAQLKLGEPGSGVIAASPALHEQLLALAGLTTG